MWRALLGGQLEAGELAERVEDSDGHLAVLDQPTQHHAQRRVVSEGDVRAAFDQVEGGLAVGVMVTWLWEWWLVVVVVINVLTQQGNVAAARHGRV